MRRPCFQRPQFPSAPRKSGEWHFFRFLSQLLACTAWRNQGHCRRLTASVVITVGVVVSSATERLIVGWFVGDFCCKGMLLRRCRPLGKSNCTENLVTFSLMVQLFLLIGIGFRQDFAPFGRWRTIGRRLQQYRTYSELQTAVLRLTSGLNWQSDRHMYERRGK